MKESSKYLFYKKLEQYFSSEFVDKVKERVDFRCFSEYEQLENKNDKFIVFEDWWIRKPNVVLGKIEAIVGGNKRVFARKTTVKRINKEEANSFLEQHHIYGSTASKHRLGLYYDGELIAVATFSAQRNLNVGRSAELIRFCMKTGITVVGGLDKLLKFYEKNRLPNHIMTYIDLDWGNGKSFKTIGFVEAGQKEPKCYYVDVITGIRTLEPLENKKYVKIYNRGSLKLERFNPHYS